MGSWCTAAVVNTVIPVWEDLSRHVENRKAPHSKVQSDRREPISAFVYAHALTCVPPRHTCTRTHKNMHMHTCTGVGRETEREKERISYRIHIQISWMLTL